MNAKLKKLYETLKGCWELVVWLATLGGIIPLVRYWSMLHDMLPLPKDLLVRGATFGVAFSFLWGFLIIWDVCVVRRPPAAGTPVPSGCIPGFVRRLLGYQFDALPQFLIRGAWSLTCFIGAAFLFERVELLWKKPAFDDWTQFIYFWLEPVTFGVACMFLAGFIVYAIFVVVEGVAKLSP